MCKDQWDASKWNASCANQEDCTDCASEGRSWCHPTNYDCDEVERHANGTSKGWSYCKADTDAPVVGNALENLRVHFC